MHCLLLRFTTAEDKQWFEAATVKVVKENLGDDMLEIMAPEPYFVDFLREAPEPTGEEPEDAVLEAPKIYELVTERRYLNLHSSQS